MSTIAAGLVAGFSALGGVSLGALLSRRNEKQAHTDRLLVDAINDAIAAVAEVAQTQSAEAQARYGGALARIALHGSPEVVAAFLAFQRDGSTVTPEGRGLLAAAVEVARRELRRGPVTTDALRILLFGRSD